MGFYSQQQAYTCAQTHDEIDKWQHVYRNYFCRKVGHVIIIHRCCHQQQNRAIVAAGVKLHHLVYWGKDMLQALDPPSWDSPPNITYYVQCKTEPPKISREIKMYCKKENKLWGKGSNTLNFYLLRTFNWDETALEMINCLSFSLSSSHTDRLHPPNTQKNLPSPNI